MILEENKRLSQSLLWQLQTIAYENFGPRAWSHKGVPSYLTTNPLIAKYYAKIAWGYLCDCHNNNTLLAHEPIYCFDLGAGTGRLSFLFLKEFLPLLNEVSWAEELKFVYVLTDIIDENRLFWLSHPQLQPYFDLGVLESAYFHSEKNEKTFFLEKSKKNLHLNALSNPFILIANYFFDTIVQDFFKIEKGIVYEGQVRLEAEGNGLSLDPSIISSLKLSWSYSALSPEKIATYYKECAGAQLLLNYYVKNYSDISFLLPYGACQTLDFFSNQSSKGMLLLASDQGHVTEKQILASSEPNISLHGSFSLPVSYHAVAEYFTQHSGKPFQTTFPDPLFVTMAAILGKNFSSVHTRQAFEFLDAFEPKDYWRLVEEGLKKNIFSLEEILLWTKLGNWDPMNFNIFFPFIREALKTAKENLRQNLFLTIEKIYQNFFIVDKEDATFLSNLGVLCFELKQFEKALFYFEQVLIITGREDPYIVQNINVCKNKLNASS